nr:IS630 family transposase [Labrys miyagiensis]
MSKRGEAYSQDLRERVLAALDSGMAARTIEPLFKVSLSYIYKAAARRRETGEVCARPQRNHVALKLAEHEEALRSKLEADPDARIVDLRAWAKTGLGIAISHARMWHMLKRLGLTYKKRPIHASEQKRPDVAAARRQWRGSQIWLRPSRLVFIDETWASTAMARHYGRCKRGQRLMPHGHWKTTTFIAALLVDGLTAPCVLDGPVNGDCFKAYVEQILAPTLEHGDIVIMDNLGSHKVPGVRQAIEAVGAELLYLPPYSPDLNPIEMLFAKFKALLRAAAKRSIHDLWDEIAATLPRFLANECRNYFSAAGYSTV